MHTVGPSRVHSMGGKWYVLVIIDDYSHYSWVFCLESKDDVLEHLRSLALRLNNEHPNCLKAIRSGNVIEFRNASLDQFCLEHCVDQQFSAPHVPQLSYPVFMPKLSTHRMHDSGSIVPHIWPKCSQISKCHEYKV
jgi:transposase InsO family protein